MSDTEFWMFTPCSHGSLSAHTMTAEMEDPGETCWAPRRVKLTPTTPNYDAANQQMRGLMPDEWEKEPWPAAFVQLIVDAALSGHHLLTEVNE